MNSCENCGDDKVVVPKTKGKLLCLECIRKKSNKSKTKRRVFGQNGWICPVCGRGNSPFTSTCPCKPPVYGGNTDEVY